jgi:DNA repair exonuclease SbcCD ATPase subunit
VIDIDSPGWYIFLLVAVAVILFFIWRFLNETKRIQEKMKGMKSFSDMIDATNQTLDEFNAAFDEAGQVIEKRREELGRLIAEAEGAIKRLEGLIEKIAQEPDEEMPQLSAPPIPEPEQEPVSEPNEERVEIIKRHLAEGKSHEEISRLTGASIREVGLVEKFSGGR